MNNHTQDQKQTTGAARRILSAPRLKAILAGVGVGVVMIFACDYALVSGESAKAASLATMVDAKRLENTNLEALIGSPEAYDDFKRQCESEQIEFDQALGAVPSEQELAAALTDLEQLMKSTGVNLVSFAPGKAIAKAKLGATEDPKSVADQDPRKDAAGTSAPPAPVTIQARPIDVTVLASFRSYQALLNALAGHSRVLTTEGFTMTSDSSRPPYTMKSKLALKVYFKDVAVAAASSTAK